MASPNPVPSRAVLNALRGVVFTTSCSVVLLAEERRRRIKTARAALDNARKLHVVRSRRGSAALAEAVGSWDTRLPELNVDAGTLPPMPQTTGVRRRRRDSPLFIGQLMPDDGLNDLADSLTAPPTTDTLSAPSAATQKPNARGPNTINLEARQVRAPRHIQHRNPISKPSSTATTDFARPRTSRPDLDGHEVLTSEQHPVPTSIHNPLLNLESHALAALEVHAEAEDAVQVARRCIETPVLYDTAGRPKYDDSLAALEALLTDLESPRLDLTEASERFVRAVEVMDRLAPVGLPMPSAAKSLRLKGLRLLKTAVTVDSGKVSALLGSLLPLCTDASRLLVPFLRWLQDTNNSDTIQKTLQLLSHRDQSRYWDGGVLLYDTLRRYGVTQTNFEETKQLYQTFQDAGLFRSITLRHTVEFKVRRQMAVLALEAGDDPFAQLEIKSLSELHPEAARLDVKLQSARILRDGRLGLWTTVQSDLDALKDTTNTNCSDFRNLLVNLTDAFAQREPVAELESFVRDLVKQHGMTMQDRWVYRVLGLHGSRQDLQSTVSWLAFCKDSGVRVSETSFRRFWSASLKYWGYSGSIVSWLQKAQAGSSGPTPSAQIGEERESERENDVFERMARLSREKQWGRVCEVYDKSASKRFSSRCFRLFVSAHVQLDHGMCDRAVELVHDAHARGYDVSDAVMTLLLGQLDNGIPPIQVIRDVLRRGIRIHDSVYNKASQKLMGSGDMRGAVTVCEMAAKQNGKGELAYNEYNLSNLMFAYTGTVQYAALESLLARFMSQEWASWHGSKICREGVKLAIKTTAKRAAIGGERGAPHAEAHGWLTETLEYVKSRPKTTHRLAVRTEILRLAGVEPEPGKQGSDVRGAKALDNRTDAADASDGQRHAVDSIADAM